MRKTIVIKPPLEPKKPKGQVWQSGFGKLYADPCIGYESSLSLSDSSKMRAIGEILGQLRGDGGGFFNVMRYEKRRKR